MLEVLQKNSVLKLQKLLKDRYGIGLQVTSMINAVDVDVRHQHSELRGSSLCVPVCARGKYLATAILTRANVLSEAEITAVVDMVRLVLEPALFSVYLERHEKNTRSEIHKNLNNVLFFNNETNKSNNTTNDDLDRPNFSTALILLESKNPHTISRIAIHIHEISGRWAFLKYAEIKDSFQSLQEIREMGALTLFIEDLLLLSPHEQEIIAKVNLTAQNEPLILIGCSSDFDELMQKKMINERLARILNASRIELNRMPQDFSQMRMAVDITLDRQAFIER